MSAPRDATTPAPSVDNWAHRSQKMRCNSCMYFVPKLVQIIASVTNRPGAPYEEPSVESSSLGRCRRHAPTLGGWPAVFDVDWCGDHKLDENRV